MQPSQQHGCQPAGEGLACSLQTIIVSLVGMLRIVSDRYARIKAPRHDAGLRPACTIPGVKRPQHGRLGMRGQPRESRKMRVQHATLYLRLKPNPGASFDSTTPAARERAPTVRYLSNMSRSCACTRTRCSIDPRFRGQLPAEICHCASNVTQYGMPSSCHRNDPHQ
jgi:hypothetical protein